MCLMFTPDEPADTLLVLAPLEADGGVQRWQLTYVNSVVGGAEVLMVVPIPNKHNMREEDFTLCAVTPQDVSRVRASAATAFEPFAPPEPAKFGSARTNDTLSFGAPRGAPPPLAVQHVGAYQISMAANLYDLETRAPWGRFPSAAGRVSSVLAGMRQSYASGFAFVIAQSTQPTKDAGFAVVYRDLHPFLPTAHEALAAKARAQANLAPMDVTILAFNSIVLPASVCTPAQLAAPTLAGLDDQPTYRVDDSGCRMLCGRWESGRWTSAASLLRALPVLGAGELHSTTLLRHARPATLCQWKLRGLYRNENVVGRVASAADVGTLADTLEQLDAFVTLRASLGEWASTGPHAPQRVSQAAGALPRREGIGAAREAVLARHGPTCDFALVLVGRQLAMPGVPDRTSDAPAPPGAPLVPQAEMYLNLDVAALRGMQHAIDLDAQSFAFKDTPALSKLADGLDLSGSVYLRIAGTPTPPPLLPTRMRTVFSDGTPAGYLSTNAVNV